MKKVTITYCAFATILISTLSSCSKTINTGKDENNAESIGDPQVIVWPLIVGAAVAVIIALAEGQYREKTTYNPNGTVKGVEKGCFGMGTCGARAKTTTGQFLSFTSNSSYVADYEINMGLIKTFNGEIVLAVHPDHLNSENANRFFYSNDSIAFLNPGDRYIIDNDEVLQALGETESIVMEGGAYTVHNDINIGKYIVVKK